MITVFLKISLQLAAFWLNTACSILETLGGPQINPHLKIEATIALKNAISNLPQQESIESLYLSEITHQELYSNSPEIVKKFQDLADRAAGLINKNDMLICLMSNSYIFVDPIKF